MPTILNGKRKLYLTLRSPIKQHLRIPLQPIMSTGVRKSQSQITMTILTSLPIHLNRQIMKKYIMLTWPSSSNSTMVEETTTTSLCIRKRTKHLFSQSSSQGLLLPLSSLQDLLLGTIHLVLATKVETEALR